MDSLWDLLRFYSHYRLLDINQVQLTKSHENDLAKTLNLQEQESTPNKK